MIYLRRYPFSSKKGYAEIRSHSPFLRATTYITPSVRSSFILIILVATEGVCKGIFVERAEAL